VTDRRFKLFGQCFTTITVTNSPNVTISASSSSVCAGGSTTSLRASDNLCLEHSATTASITVTPSSTTTYSVTGSSGSNCSGSASKTITVTNSRTLQSRLHLLPFVQEAQQHSLQVEQRVMFGARAQLQRASLLAQAQRQVQRDGINGSNCSAVLTNNYCNQLTNVTISASSSSVCAGGSTTLTASGATSYVWSTGATTASITVTRARPQLIA